MMRVVYTIALVLMLPLFVGRLLARGLRDRGYSRAMAERFGFGPDHTSQAPLIWVHAVSVGEAQAAVPLIQALRTRYRQCSILVTTVTPTGRRRVQQVFGDTIECRYLPYDLPFMVERFLVSTRPIAGILMETELWPNLLSACARHGVPLSLVNARLSAQSAGGYGRFPALTGPMLSSLAMVSAQSADDAARLMSLGAKAERVEVTGNIKLDVHIPASAGEAAQALRRSLGSGRSVWIAASTHPGEEEVVLRTHRALRERIPELVLILVPRHPDRADLVERLCQRAGLKVVRRTVQPNPGADTEVYLGDTLGELPTLYAAADVAFVGGSLVASGGHNLLEPAALAVPVVLGPHMFNFADLTERMISGGIAVQVDGPEQLTHSVSALLGDPDRRHEMGQLGRAFVLENRGALERILAQLGPILSRRLADG